MSIPLSTIDLDQGTQVIGDPDGARKTLDLFVEKLPEYHRNILSAYQNRDWEKLSELMHALKGATCYSSTPALHQQFCTINDIFSQLKSEQPGAKVQSAIQKNLNTLNDNIQTLYDTYKTLA